MKGASACFTALAMSTAFGVSECTHTESARTGTSLPATLAALPSSTARSDRVAACCGSTAVMLARDDQAAALVVVEVGVELGHEGKAALLVDPLVQGAGHAEQRHAEHLSGVAHGVRHLLLARRHAVQHAVRLDVVERHAFGLEKGSQRADLVDQQIRELGAGDPHLAPAEALEVGEGGVGADLDPVLLGEAHGLVHHHRVRGVEATGDVGDRDVRHDAFVVAHFVEAEALAHVAVDRHCHRELPSQMVSWILS